MKYAKTWKNLGLAAFLFTGFGISASANVFAQDATVGDDSGLDEITVTARKRVENLQEVALSVSAMGRREIELEQSSSSKLPFITRTDRGPVLFWHQQPRHSDEICEDL